MQMKVSVTSTMFTNVTSKLSKCVCEIWTECSLSLDRIQTKYRHKCTNNRPRETVDRKKLFMKKA
ncbi:hypothetical protein Hdeb2414_s0032g00712901 [Helianthus debilis subsp. tardiflorus]